MQCSTAGGRNLLSTAVCPSGAQTAPANASLAAGRTANTPNFIAVNKSTPAVLSKRTRTFKAGAHPFSRSCDGNEGETVALSGSRTSAAFRWSEWKLRSLWQPLQRLRYCDVPTLPTSRGYPRSEISVTAVIPPPSETKFNYREKHA